MAEGASPPDADDDPFESVLFLEDRCYRDGYNEGWNIGKQKGILEGHRLGMEKGREVGSELGFYSGFVSTWILLNKSTKPEKKKERIKKALDSLQKHISSLSGFDPTDELLFEGLEKIRAKFKQVCSLLGVSSEYGSQSKKDLSF